jgi:hypothetical protein
MSALAIKDDSLGAVTVSATLVFYGSEATEERAQRMLTEIVDMYNEPQAHIVLDGRSYRVYFEMTYRLATINEVMELARGNENFRYNFIRIETANLTTRSFMGFGLGDNAGHWITTDELGTSTTAAHEFGHAMGLDHPTRLDFRGLGNPGIMAPRGTIVDAHWQWNPQVAAGEYGGTLRPVHRRVQAHEVQAIFEKVTFDANGFAAIGYLSNILFFENGQPVRVY